MWTIVLPASNQKKSDNIQRKGNFDFSRRWIRIKRMATIRQFEF